jgi:hypothetical protein
MILYRTIMLKFIGKCVGPEGDSYDRIFRWD